MNKEMRIAKVNILRCDIFPFQFCFNVESLTMSIVVGIY